MLTDLLDDILDKRRLTPLFQPIVHLGNNSVYGYEALIRGAQRPPTPNIHRILTGRQPDANSGAVSHDHADTPYPNPEGLIMVGASALHTLADIYTRHVTAREALLMLRYCDLRRRPRLVSLFVGITRLGDGPLWWGSALFFVVVGTPRMRSAVAVAVVAVFLAVTLFKFLKRRIGRPRPFHVWLDLPCLLAPPDRFSFPSGHTMTAFTCAAVYAELIPASAPFFLPAAALIGLSRVFLGCHYPTDILVGALLGTGIGSGCVWLALYLFSF